MKYNRHLIICSQLLRLDVALTDTNVILIIVVSLNQIQKNYLLKCIRHSVRYEGYSRKYRYILSTDVNYCGAPAGDFTCYVDSRKCAIVLFTYYNIKLCIYASMNNKAR